MNFKKKSLIFSLLIIISIQILLLINNRQKTSFRYLIWNYQEVTIGRLICFSFISGLLMSSVLNNILNINTLSEKDINDKSFSYNDNLINRDYNNETPEITPERDLRDTQPTISVKYRVIKNNGGSKFNDIDDEETKTEYADDWNNNNFDW